MRMSPEYQRITAMSVWVLLFGVITVSAAAPGVTGRNSVVLKAPPKVVPFKPECVRILEGPFRENQARDIDYMLSIEPDRLLHMFRVNAGLPSTAKPLGGWESPHVWVRGQGMGHYLTACALMYASTGDERLKTRADAIVAELATCQQALQKQGSNSGYLSAFPEAFFDNLDANRQTWAPWYVIHKIMAGLLDMHLHCGNKQALDMLEKTADWVKFRVDRRSEQQMQQALKVEFGGMGEVLANLYAVTGKPDHLHLARCFDHKAVYDPLAAGEDRLDGEHGNTLIPKIIGASRAYELTGEQRYRDIAEFFWRSVALKRSFAHGGNSDREHFFPVAEFSKHLSPMAAETCNTYNMLKLTGKLFGWEPSAAKMDFYERALFNHILGSQDPVKGTTIYFASTRPGFFKLYATPFDSFWCCTGTGMENPARYGEAIYYHDDKTLFVNLFMASKVDWKEKGIIITQETKFPENDSSRLTFSCKAPVKLSLKIRWPAWVKEGFSLAVNGELQKIAGQPGSYMEIDRDWKDGDKLDIRIPMKLHTEALLDDPKTVAVMYGPIVLAGEMGADKVTETGCYLMSNASMLWLTCPHAPMLECEAKEIPSHIEKIPGDTLKFRKVGIGRPVDLSLIPYYRLHHQRFTIYWKLCSKEEWSEIAATRKKAASERKQLEPQIVDEIIFGNGLDEHQHKLDGKGRSSEAFQNRIWTESAKNGFISLEMKVKEGKPMHLRCTYWGAEAEETVQLFTGKMNPTGPRAFDILVDDKKIGEQNLTPNQKTEEFFNVEYAIPEELTKGKEKVTVKLQAHKDGTAGRIFACMMLQATPRASAGE